MLARAAPIHHPVKIGMSMEHDTLRFDAVSETGGVRVESKVNETGRMCDDCTGWIASWWTIWSMNTIKQVWFRSPFDMRMYADHARLLGMLLSLDTMFIGECVGFAVEDSLRPWFQILLTHQLNMSTVPCPALTTLHVWLGKSSINPDIITTFVATRAQLGLPIKRLLVECHEQSPFDKSFDWAVTHPHVDAVEFLVSRTTPGMGLLDSCVTEPHEYWPAW
ncbi:hypothetical protein SCP_0704210 [Sparassis crispa]|uniref:Uncharacterized protein n=1 Tax=Sparassis crispa TaxID=139825 RepID=A0A401GSP3_9APHY|nr:hypothetical protein SCP_0704210 [Sparassis crispa]GBE85235.1 hypothetical protein SCP_0704210 [Sparassis crispa]